MRPKFAILLDGGFVVARLRARERRFPHAAEVLSLCERIRVRPELEGLGLLRVYWYDAPPASQRIQNPLDDGGSIDLRATTRFSEAQELHDALELAPNFALRMGEVVFRGWQVRRGRIDTLGKAGRPIQADDLVPQLEQKGVDLRIGLDIARLALRGLVDTLVVVTGDSDLIPAFKFARREGVRVLLEPLGAPVRRELKAHADAVLASA